MTTSNPKRPPRPLVCPVRAATTPLSARVGMGSGAPVLAADAHRTEQRAHLPDDPGGRPLRPGQPGGHGHVGVRAGCGLAAQRASQWSSRGQHRTVFVHGHPTVWSGSRRRWRSSRPTNDGTVSSARLCAWSSAAYLVGATTVRTRRAARPLSNCRLLRSGRAHAPEAAITEQ